MQLHKLARSYISLHGVTWACMQFPELLGSSTRLHEVPWPCMQFHGLACSFMILYAVSWACIQFYELSCSFISLQEISWACMHFLSLSEQLTRISMCLLVLVLCHMYHCSYLWRPSIIPSIVKSTCSQSNKRLTAFGTVLTLKTFLPLRFVWSKVLRGW